MHILIVPSWYPVSSRDISGCFFREQALALKRHGCQVGVIDIKLRLPKSWRLLFTDFFGTDINVDEGLITYRYCGVDWFRRIPTLQRRLWLNYGMKLVDSYISHHGKPDIIHAHAMLNGGLLAKAISGKYAIPYVVTEHSTAYASGDITQQQFKLVREVSASAARRFAVSGEFCTLLQRKLDDALHWEEMPNIIKQNFIEADLITLSGRKKPFIFLTVALLTKKKAVHNLVSAFALRFANNPNVILKIAGDGVERFRLEALALKLGVADRVLFLGMLSRKQVMEEISNANIFVLSSRFETFGVVVIEALALGKPVIATRCGGPESIVRKQDGILIPIDDVTALAEAMKEMLSNYGYYDAAEIRAACISRYSENVIAERLSAVYSQVLAASDEVPD